MTENEDRQPITVAKPIVDAAARELLLGAVASGQLAQGKLVARLEELCAEMAGAEHAIAVSSGTDALEIAYEAAGIGPGDEIITTPLTFGATVNAALRLGATVRFADIGDDHNIDPASIAQQLTPRTKAIVPVHLFGLPADMDAIAALTPAGVTIVEDAAQAHGALVGTRLVGTQDIGCFSFYATKNVFAGEGGVISTDRDDVAERCRLLRNQGMTGPYDYRVVGRNSRMSDLHAAIAIPQLERLRTINERRAKLAATYDAALSALPELRLPTEPDGRTSVWHQYTVVLPPSVDRAEVVDALKADAIHPGVYYPAALNDVPLYRDHPQVEPGTTPRARAVAASCLSLPVHHGLEPSDIERVAGALTRALAGGRSRATS